MSSSMFMPAASIIFLFSFPFGIKVASAVPWTGPQETNVHRAEELSPKTTQLPAKVSGLVKRDWVPVGVCGWIAGRPENVAGCGARSFCIHDTIHQVLGCCATAGPCTDGVFTTCIDSRIEGWEPVPGSINNGVLSCKVSSTCFQNKQGNYKQYSCGESNLEGDIYTTYSGQAPDMKLQIVYTGITFSPMSKAVSTSVTAAQTGIVEGSKDNKDESSSYIAGGTVGGVAFAAILIAGIILYFRRRKSRMGQRVGGFVSLQHEEKPPTANALKRLTARYSVAQGHDFGPLSRRSTAQEVAYMSAHTEETTYISPLTGHPDEAHASNDEHESEQQRDRDLLCSPLFSNPSNGGFTEAYGTSTMLPISRLNIHASNAFFPKQNISSPLQPLSEEREQGQPLVGVSVDYPGQSWDSNLPLGYGGLAKHQSTHIHSGDMPETTDMGLFSTVRRAASQLISGNAKTVDLNAGSESIRRGSIAVGGSHEALFDDEIWRMHPTMKEDTAPVELDVENIASSSSGSSVSRPLVSSDKESNLQAPQRMKNPSVEQILEAFNAATRAGGDPSVVVKKDFQRLVDEGVGSGSDNVGGESGLNRGISTIGLLRKPLPASSLQKRGKSDGEFF